MEKTNLKLFFGVAVLCLVFWFGFYSKSGSLGQAVQTCDIYHSTTASSSVGVASTSILSLAANSCYGQIVNLGTQDVSCAINETPVLDQSLTISSTTPSRVLQFGANYIPAKNTIYCIANTTTSVKTLFGNAAF